MEKDFSKYNLSEFENYLISGDYEKALELVKDILNEEIEIKVLYDEILKKSLYKVGEMWEANKITVATEHLASAIVETLLSEVYFKIVTKDKIDKTVVVACTENEFHQIGIKMVSDVFEMNGWKVVFLGANSTTDIIIETVEAEKPDILAISLSVPFNLPVLDKMLFKIRERFPEQFILVGGQAFLHGGFDVLNKYEKVIYKSDLKDLEEFLKSNV
jgi:methanogenic corrinoid protein MtbC1